MKFVYIKDAINLCIRSLVSRTRDCFATLANPSLIPPLVRGDKGGCFLSLRGVSATKQSHFLKPIKLKDERIKGDHHIFTKPDIIEIINNEEPCSKTAGYLNVRNFSLSYSLANPRSKQAVRQFKISCSCHSEFISESRIFNVLYLRQILKRVQDDICRTACFAAGFFIPLI